ncbi:MAG TPA: type II toxin-antitoxin system Phd/YefM family antitoxin [Caldilineaceae bacterium]|nr:type II toxin-antitoxin system Phd/YefM family antitoxin [Caldilineaceae bacterium]
MLRAMQEQKRGSAMIQMDIGEAATQLSQLLQQVMMGEEVIIAKAGEPIAKLVPFHEKPQKRIPGTAKGRLWIAPDFNTPLPPEILDAFEGKESMAV